MLRRIGYILIPSLFILLAVTAYGNETSEPNLDTSKSPARESFKTTVNANAMEKRGEFKEKMASFAANFKARREEFKEKLQTIKDEKKKTLTERIDTKFSTINKNRTARWVESLNKLSEITGRLDGKIASAEAAGKDVASAQAALEKANDAIATAQSAVSSQAGKEYVIEITDEKGLRLAVGKVMSQLQADLRATHKTVIDAKKAVMKAATEVRKLTSGTP